MLPHDITRNGDITEVKILNINKYYKTDKNVDFYRVDQKKVCSQKTKIGHTFFWSTLYVVE